jgi:hypothetical protein
MPYEQCGTMPFEVYLQLTDRIMDEVNPSIGLIFQFGENALIKNENRKHRKARAKRTIKPCVVVNT